MARLPRYAAPGAPQHVIQRGNNRSALFVADSDFRIFRDILEEACARHGCQLHAYVLMHNHVHLLMTPVGAGAVGKVLQAVGRRYVQRFNTLHRRTGTLWEGRYRATLIETESYLFTCYRYIELNPVRAGLVAEPGAYRWSSYRANAEGAHDSAVIPHQRYIALGPDAAKRQAAYRAMFATTVPESTLADIRAATNTGWALGSERFREEIAALVGRRAAPRARGRRRRERSGPRV